ncbi:MAG: serine/threonine protein kinase [Herpetosiphonaceae bacterium]|nr:serine/threonine protein kinase [Herpetosiphonaceae bacterium]
MVNLLNTTLGKYTLLEELGAGGMGAVYRSFHPQLNRAVAIKVILGNATPEARQRFVREAQMAVQISHPHIVRVFDVDEDNGMPYIVMEFIEGPSLAGLMKSGRMPLEQVLKIGTELADALEYAHSQGVLHRDLKPGNVLIRPNGSTVLVDFGLARLAEVDPGEQLTQSGMIVGTLAYMAPEQIQAQPLDRRTDIYALGVLLFQMVTGRLPFEGDTAQIMFGHVYTNPPAPSMTGALLPPALDALVLAMMNKQSIHRPQTMAEVAHVLRLVTKDATTPAGYGAYTGPTQGRSQSMMPTAVPYQQAPVSTPGFMPVQHTVGYHQPAGGYGPPPPAGGYGPPAQPIYTPPVRKGGSPILFIVLGALLLVGGLGAFGINKILQDNGRPPPPPLITLGDSATPAISLPPPRPTEFGAPPPTRRIVPTRAPVIVPTQVPEEEQKLTVANMRTRSLPGDDTTTWFYGSVTNEGTVPREGIKVTVVLLDKDGKELDHEDGYVGLSYLNPGQKVGWSVLFSRKLQPYDRAEIEVRSKPAGFQLGYSYRDLKIEEGSELIEDFFPVIRGNVTNTGTKRAKFVQIYATVYDGDGNVMYVGSGFAEDDVVVPGATSRFEVTILVTAKGGVPTSYDLFVEGAEDTE